MGLGWVWGGFGVGLGVFGWFEMDLEILRVRKVWLRAGLGLVWVGLGAGQAWVVLGLG